MNVFYFDWNLLKNQDYKFTGAFDVTGLVFPTFILVMSLIVLTLYLSVFR